MKGLIINHGSSYTFDLAKLFSNCDVVSYTHFNVEHANQYDYIVLSGGEINISSEIDIPLEKTFLKNFKKPIFGVCLGMQILSIIEGKKLKELPGRRILNEHLNFCGVEGDMTYHHGWYIDEIPDGYQGFIEDGIVKFIYNEHIIAFQGHPEMSGEFGKNLKKFFYDNYLDNKGRTESKTSGDDRISH